MREVGVRSLPAFECFDGAFAAIDLVIRVDGDEVKGAGADSGGLVGGFDNNAALLIGLKMDDVERDGGIGDIADVGFPLVPGKVDLKCGVLDGCVRF